MTVQFKQVRSPGWRWSPRRGPYWTEPHAHALVDDYSVKVTPDKGWTCTCSDDDCGHIDAVADLIHPHALALLDGDRVIPPKEKMT